MNYQTLYRDLQKLIDKQRKNGGIIRNLVESNKEKQASLTLCETDKATFETQVRELVDNNTQILKQTEGIMDYAKKLEDEKNSLTEEITNLNNKLQTDLANRGNLDQQVREQIENLNQLVETKNAENTRLSTIVENLKENSRTLHTKMNTLIGQGEAIERERNSLIEIKNTLSTELTNKNNLALQLEAANKNMADQLNTATSQMSYYQSENVNLNAQLNELNSKVVLYGQNSNDELERLKAQLGQSTDDMVDLVNDYEKLKIEYQQTKNENSDLVQKCKAIESSYVLAIEGGQSNAPGPDKGSKSKIEAKYGKVTAAIKSENTQLKNDNNQLRDEVKDLQNKLKTAQGLATNLNSSNIKTLISLNDAFKNFNFFNQYQYMNGKSVLSVIEYPELEKLHQSKFRTHNDVLGTTQVSFRTLFSKELQEWMEKITEYRINNPHLLSNEMEIEV